MRVRSLEDPFRLLGVDPDADEGQVKKAYRKLALRYGAHAPTCKRTTSMIASVSRRRSMQFRPCPTRGALMPCPWRCYNCLCTRNIATAKALTHLNQLCFLTHTFLCTCRRYHPDVNKDELAEAKFKALREAYDLLLGKGSDSSNNTKAAPFGGNWDMHDWYWTFGMRKRQRRQNPATAPQHSAAAAQKHKPQVHSQLTNLKRRAARRRARCVLSISRVRSYLVRILIAERRARW